MNWIHETIWLTIWNFEEDFNEDYTKIEKFLKSKYVKFIDIIYGEKGILYLLLSISDKSSLCNALKLDGVLFEDNRLAVNVP